MQKLTINDFRDGFPTKHRIKFKSRRTIVEGGYRLGDHRSIREYEGILFESNHSDTHLCVRVDHEDHWGRSRDWHGCVGRNNVIGVALVDDDGKLVPSDRLDQVADMYFLNIWSEHCENTTSPNKDRT